MAAEDLGDKLKIPEFVDGIESVIIGVDRDRKFNPINWYLEQRAKN